MGKHTNSLGIRGRKHSPLKCRRGIHRFEDAGKSNEHTFEWCCVCGCLQKTNDKGDVILVRPDSQK